MKVIFLDIDGVMNYRDEMTDKAVKRGGFSHLFFDTPSKRPIKALNKIIEETDAKVVISSTWRLNYPSVREFWRMLWLCGFNGEVIGFTPCLSGKYRGHEIAQWLKNTDRNVEQFVIIDDDSDMAHLIHRLYKTDNKKGLTKKDVKPIINMLNDEPEIHRDEEMNFQKSLGIKLVE